LDALLREQARSAEREAVLRQSQKMEAIGRLTAGIAHDFNNLLQAQLGSLELLQDEVADRPTGRKFASIAISTAERGAQLTHYLLAFSRKQVLQPKQVHLQNLLGSIREVLPRLLGSRITVRVAIEAHLPPAFADISQVETALLNLALNARDAMPEGGELAIEAHASSAGPGAPPALLDGNYIVISVNDTGCGMDPITMAQACEPFFTTKGSMGSGLGLSMVHGFARQSGGDLRLTSAPGQGTRAEIWLPLDKSYTSECPSLRPARIEGRRAGRVLLVDDAEDVLLTLSTFLQGTGYQVVSVDGGQAALDVLAQDGEFDVLVTDYAMPELDGMALLREMAAIRPGLPALIVTGFADVALDQDLPAPVHLLRKPFRRDELMRALDALVRIRSASAASAG
jgi:nitrogen-specific signal transduction histidine kinase/CheY-like chemotaxis protein